MINFLTYNEILFIHSDQLKRYGGAAEVRDDDLLKSALGQVEITMGGEYLHKDLFLMAAAYLYHIVNNHPFIDGNKRVGFVSALVFLQINGVIIQAETESTEQMVLSVAEGKIKKETIANWLKDHSQTL